MAAEWIGPAIGAGASLIGAGASAVATGNLNKKNRAWQEQQSKEQREWSEGMWNSQNAWNMEMWNKENEYNSPAQQIERLREAGLNPLFYGLDGTGNASALESAQPLGYERASSFEYQNPVTAGIDSAYKMSQLTNLQAQTQKIKSETKAIDAKLPFEVDSLKAQVRNSNLSSDAQETINKYLDRQQEAELRLKDANASEAEKSVEKAVAEIDKMDYEKTTMYIGWLETLERILNLQKQRELTDKQMEELSSLIAKNSAEAKKIGLDVQNYDDITVIGTASTSMRFGPFSVAEGEPITLGMKKAAEEHLKQLKEEEKKSKPKSMKDIKAEYPE